MRDIQFPFAQDKRFYERLLTDLEAIADRRDHLISKIRWAHLRFELIGLDAAEQEALAAEVAAFKRVCIAIADLLVDADHEERPAS
jgi:hypothetical protein